MIVLDVETTGRDPVKHSIVSMGAIDFSKPTYQLYRECRMRAGAEVTAEALAINGFTEEQVKDPRKPSLDVIMRDLCGWILMVDDRTLAGQNPSFDRDFCSVAAAYYHIPLVLGSRTIDLHTLCYAHHLRRGLQPPQKNGRTDLNTDKILQYVGLPPEPQPHHALTGAKMEAEAFSRLISGKGLLPEFAQYPVPAYLGHNL